MKVPPKRKGNLAFLQVCCGGCARLNESPSEKEGKFAPEAGSVREHNDCLNESPSEKEGKYAVGDGEWFDAEEPQ